MQHRALITAECGSMAGDRTQSCCNGCMLTALGLSYACCRTMTTGITGCCVSSRLASLGCLEGKDHSENSSCLNTSDEDWLGARKLLRFHFIQDWSGLILSLRVTQQHILLYHSHSNDSVVHWLKRDFNLHFITSTVTNGEIISI